MIEVGSVVRYPKTGTVGTVLRFVEKSRFTFAELDSTGLLYRVDLLIPAVKEERVSSSQNRDEDMKKVAKEHDSVSRSFDDAVFQQDGACHGGG